MQPMKIAGLIAVAFALLATSVAAGTTSSTRLDGVYRVNWTEKQLIAAGASASYAKHNHSVITMTMRDGRFTQHWSVPPGCAGTYAVSGNTVSIRQKQQCHGLVVARWSLAQGQLRLRITKASDPGDRILYGGKPWGKVG
jgi:hypothetical protein